MRLIDADALPIDVMLIDDEEELVFVSQYDIDHAPTVDAVPVRHGKWKEKTYEMDVYGQKVTTITYYCTVCGAEHSYGRENYCPNCGAKMDGGENDG